MCLNISSVVITHVDLIVRNFFVDSWFYNMQNYATHYVIMNIPRDYDAQMIDSLYDPEEFSQLVETSAVRMILIILCILVLSLGNDVIASFRVDDVIVRFIVNATPTLFPPSRVSLHLCINYGKIFVHVHDFYIY